MDGTTAGNGSVLNICRADFWCTDTWSLILWVLFWLIAADGNRREVADSQAALLCTTKRLHQTKTTKQYPPK